MPSSARARLWKSVPTCLPGGLGEWLTVDGRFTHFFVGPISAEDAPMYGIPGGTADRQQLWERLAVLIAVDIWTHLWSQSRIILKVRGDNVGALTSLIKMRPATPTIAIVAKELALRLVELSFPPDAVHAPGVARMIADKLSRAHAPRGGCKVDKSIHPALADAGQAETPVCNHGWYRA